MTMTADDVNSRSFKYLSERDDVQTMDDDIFCKGDSRRIQASLSKSRMKKFKQKLQQFSFYFLCPILLLWTIVSIVMITSDKSDNQPAVEALLNIKSETKICNFSTALLLTANDNEIRKMNPKTMGHTILHKNEKKLISIDTSVNCTILMIEENATTINSFPKNQSNGTYFGILKPTATAVDHINRKLYIVDELSETLSIIDLRYDYFAILLSDLKKPHDIVLDSVQGLMFIVQLHDSLLRVDMDGKSTNELKSNQICAVAINRIVKRVYWANSFTNIESSDYDGNHRTILTPVLTDVFSLTILDNELFWICPSHNPDNSLLFSCDVQEDDCRNESKRMYEITFKSKIVRALQKQRTIPFENPCDKKNGGCEHICLLAKDGTHSCACKIGWNLNSNKMTCSPLTISLIYSRGEYFRKQSIDLIDSTFKDSMVPVKYYTKILENKESIDSDIGWNDNEVIFSDDETIYTLNLIDGSQSEIFTVGKDHFIKRLSLDRSTQTIYFLQFSKFTSNFSIQAIRQVHNNIIQKTITSYNSGCTRRTFYSLVVHKYIFLLPCIENNQIIKKSLSGNSNKNYWTIPKENTNVVLAVDNVESTLYWILEYKVDSFTIEYSPEKGGSVKTFKVSIRERNFLNMYVYGQWIFISNPNGIWKFDKKTGTQVSKIASTYNINRLIHGVMVISNVDTKINDTDNKCLINNGDCEQFCFNDDEITCGCGDKFRIRDVGRCG